MTLKPSDPVPSRPEPAVGQVWQSPLGNKFLIMKVDSNDMEIRVFFDEAIAWKLPLPLLPSDTFKGVWDGVFNVVQEEGGKC